MINLSIRLNDKVKEKLDKYKAREGCTSYSEAVNRLLLLDVMHQEIDNWFDSIRKRLDTIIKENLNND